MKGNLSIAIKFEEKMRRAEEMPYYLELNQKLDSLLELMKGRK